MPDSLDAYLDPAPRNPRERVYSVASRIGIAPEIADDYLKLTQVESGHNINVRDSAKGAKGFGQVMPDRPGGTTRTVGGQRYNLTDPDQNIEAGLRYFSEGGPDPVARRLYYFGGPRARQQYQRTGRIPNISDGNMTAAQYVQATGGRKQQPTTDLDSYLDPQPSPEQAALPSTQPKQTRQSAPSPATGQQTAPSIPQGLLLPPGQRNRGAAYKPKRAMGIVASQPQASGEVQQRHEQEVRQQVEQEVKSRYGPYGSPTLTGALHLAANPSSAITNIFKPIDQQIDEETQARLKAEQVAQEPEVTSIRKEYGAMPAAERSVVAPLVRGGAGILRIGGGIASAFGIAPNQLSNWANKRADIIESGAANAPLRESRNPATDQSQLEEVQRGIPEKIATGLADLGVGIGEIVLLQKATGLSMPKLLALEGAAKASDKPVSEQIAAAGEGYALGSALNSHLSRGASAALFGIPTAAQTGYEVSQGRMSPLDAAIQTGVQAGAGAVLGGGRRAAAQPIEPAVEPRGTPVTSDFIERNRSVLSDPDFRQHLLTESVGGNAGEGRAAVNVVLDPEGRIVRFGNEPEQDLPPLVRERLASGDYSRASVVFKDALSENPQPEAIIPHRQATPPQDLGEGWSVDFEDPSRSRGEVPPEFADVADLAARRSGRETTTTIPEVAATERSGEGDPLREETPRVPTEPTVRGDLPDQSVAIGQVESAPARFYHRDFGEVTESPNQKRVGKGRVRVVAEDESEHVIKRASLTGAGNQRAVPIREPTESVQSEIESYLDPRKEVSGEPANQVAAAGALKTRTSNQAAEQVKPAPSNPSVKESQIVKPWEMTREQIEQEFQRKKAEDENVEVSVLGPELAQKYKRLQRTANSSYDTEKADRASDEIERIEASLSERDRNRLYGIGEEGPQVEELRDYRQSLGNLDDSDPQSLAQSMRWAVSRVGNETDPTRMTHEQQVAFGTLREAARIAYERGWDTQAISREAVKAAAARFSDPEDARMMLDRFITKEQKPEAPQRKQTSRQNRLGEKGAIDIDLLTFGLRPFAKEVTEKGRTGIQGVKEIADGIRSILAPATRGPEARTTAAITRANASEMARAHDIAEKSLEGARKYFQNQSTDANYEFIDRMERGESQPDPKTQKFADTLRGLLDERRDQIRALGTGKLESFIENYFPHIWKDPTKAKTFFGQGRRPLEGSKSFLKQRTIPFTKEGLDHGLEPVSNNPVDLAVLKLREMDKYLMAHKTMMEMKENGLLKFIKSSERVPEGYQKIDDRVATVYGGPSSRPEGGQLIRGYYVAPEPAAKILNNYLSPGIEATALRVPFKAWRATANLMNQAQLGLSFFHGGFTTLDAMVSRTAAGLEDIFRHGKPLRGIKTIASTPLSPLTNLVQGSKVLSEWYKPGSQGAEITKLADAMQEAGGRAKMDRFYTNNAVDKFKDVLKQGNLIGAALRLPGATIEKATSPIMEWLVPRQKAGIFAEMAKRELERLGPNATREQTRQALAKAWDSVDNRMGQMVYDNIFWNKVTKDLAMASVRSVGWNLGTAREVAGGLVDYATLPKRALTRGRTEPLFTHKMAYATALPLVVGTMGAMTQYLLTGSGPRELKDYFFPKTGLKDENGNDERIALPSYMKDIFHVKEEPGKVITSKLHPLISTIAEMLSNRDYYGTKIRNEDDPYVQQVKDVATHLGKSVIPFSIRGFQKESERGAPLHRKILPFIGVTPAPSYINQTPAEKLMSKITEERMPAGSRTKEEAERSQLRHKLQALLRQGKTVDQQIREGVNNGILRPDDARGIQRDAKQLPDELRFKRLGVKDAVKVYTLMSSSERAVVADEFEKKYRLISDLPVDEQDEARRQFKEFGIGQAGSRQRPGRPSRAERPTRATRQ